MCGIVDLRQRMQPRVWVLMLILLLGGFFHCYWFLKGHREGLITEGDFCRHFIFSIVFILFSVYRNFILYCWGHELEMAEEEKDTCASPSVQNAGSCGREPAQSPGVWQMQYTHLMPSSVSSVVQHNGQTSSQTQGASLFTHVQERWTQTETGTRNCYEVNEMPVSWEETRKRLLI